MQSVRRGGVITAVVLILAAGAQALGGTRSSVGIVHGPNVLLIVTDDQRARATLSVMPNTRAWFEAGGTKFTNAFATTPLCCPSRASILTGRYSHNHGVWRNQDGPKLDFATTLPHLLQQRGYQTALEGKFIQGLPLGASPPDFDTWTLFSWGYFNRLANFDGVVRRAPGYITDLLGRRAEQFLTRTESDDARPWFLYFAPSAPHKPFAPARRYKNRPTPVLPDDPSFHEINRSDKPAFLRTTDLTSEKVQLRLQRYLDVLRVTKDVGATHATIAQTPPFTRREGQAIWRRQLDTLRSVDDVMGDLVSLLQRLDEERNTIAIFLSDNGLLLGEHGIFGKRVPYDPSVRIPLLMRWPGRVAAGAVDDRLAANIDVAPTVLEAAGLPRPDWVDGRSLLQPATRSRLLLEQLDNSRENSARLPEWASLRTPTYQYTEYRRRDESVFFREYYDLVSDPWAKTNLLADDDPAGDPDVAALHRQLVEDSNCRGSSCP